MSTKLSNIVNVTEDELLPEEAEKFIQRILGILESRKEQGIIEIIPVYNGEMSRILYAFSCFEKEVEYVQEADTYRITLTFQADECEYVLSKSVSLANVSRSSRLPADFTNEGNNGQGPCTLRRGIAAETI